MNPASRLLITFAALVPVLAAAQETAAPDSSTQSTPAPISKFRDPEDGQIDLGRYLATPRKQAGSEGYARPNMSIVGAIAIATENGTWAAFAGDSSH